MHGVAGAPAASLGAPLLLAAAVLAGWPVAVQAWRALTVRVVGIDLLVTVAAVGAVALGELWEAAAVTTLFAVGKALEGATLDRTRGALADLVASAPERAVVVRDGRQLEVPAAEVVPGETVVVRHGERVPVDGLVVAGFGAVDESAITGESVPAEKSGGERVFAGTVAVSGLLRVRATGVGADTTLARIVHRVEEAQDAKGRTQRFMDGFGRWYTPAIVGLSALAALVTRDVELALTLLVIGCPGALVISVPVSVVAGIGRAARDGVLVKGGETLEALARVDVVALDKTGTLTLGRPRVVAVEPLPGVSGAELLRYAAAAEAGSSHPLARPVVEAAEDAGVGPGDAALEAETVPGKGVVARVGGHRVVVGSTRFAAEVAARDAVEASRLVGAKAERLAAAGRTPLVVLVDGSPLGVVGVADRARDEAARAVEELRRLGVREVAMLTGDAEPVARAVAREVGVTDVRAGLLPEDKLAAVRELRARGRAVAMVGDGVNDAPALAAADVGVAMGAAGSAVAVETADVALMSDDLRRLPHAVRVARRTAANLRQNVAFAVATVLLLLVGVAAGGVTMSLGMLVHEASVLLVVLNGMRLLRPLRSGQAAAA
ncbi:MAG TPA: cation-translocating P-type ATPase [Trueperaceae bacterium]|nr:cation-translocating P-type ATPase [Trueperaceae bacterium]